MKPETRAHIVTKDITGAHQGSQLHEKAYKIALRTILEAHRQSIKECADLALAYGREEPYARTASQLIAGRITQDADRYPIPEFDERKERSSNKANNESDVYPRALSADEINLLYLMDALKQTAKRVLHQK